MHWRLEFALMMMECINLTILVPAQTGQGVMLGRVGLIDECARI